MTPCPLPDSPAGRAMRWRAMAECQRASVREERVWFPRVEAERRAFQSAACLRFRAVWPRCRALRRRCPVVRHRSETS